MLVAEDTPDGERAEGPWERKGITRRDWVKLGLVAGALGGAAAVGVMVGGSLLSSTQTGSYPPDALIYTRFPTDQWWNDKDGQPMRVGDFGLWQGATGIFRGTYSEGKLVPGTGLPVLAIRIPRDDTNFQSPPASEFPLLEGYSLYYDDPARDIRIVVLYDRCVHLCCFPGWHVVTNPPPTRDYTVPCPTYQVYGLDPIYCICHGSQYDPLVLTKSANPLNGVTYVGAGRVHGPADRSVPVLAVRVDGDILYGGLADERWYQSCGD